MGGSTQLMHRIRSIVAALAALSVTAGLAAAHVLPDAANGGIQQAQSASGKSVPMGVDGSLADRSAQDNTNGAPTDTHGATVSAAAQAETPDGFDNHGAYVSSIAKGWGTQTADAHRDGAGAQRPTPEPPTAATNGLTHRP